MQTTFPTSAWTALLAAALLLWVGGHGTSFAAQESYVVQEGESLSAIAGRFEIDLEALIRVNGIDDPNHLVAGQTLRLPSGPGGEHEVQPGETLGGIAARYGLTLEDLVDVNQLLDPDTLAAGLVLRLPGGTIASTDAVPTVPEPDAAQRPASRTHTLTYLVQPGDTLSTIAHAFETTVDTLLAANGLANPDLLLVGQTIDVPARAIEHQVEHGETLAAIAAKYTVDLGSLIDFNGLADPNLIRADDRLAIPHLGIQARPQTVEAPQFVAATGSPEPRVAEASAPPPGGSNIGAAMVSLASRLVGKPYVWGGSSEEGFDCSGLVWYVANHAGVDISRGLLGQFNAGPTLDRAALQPGDLVFFQNTYMPGLSHNGIYIGDGKFVHASDERSGVTVSLLAGEYWATRWFGATRVG